MFNQPSVHRRWKGELEVLEGRVSLAERHAHPDVVGSPFEGISRYHNSADVIVKALLRLARLTIGCPVEYLQQLHRHPSGVLTDGLYWEAFQILYDTREEHRFSVPNPSQVREKIRRRLDVGAFARHRRPW